MFCGWFGLRNGSEELKMDVVESTRMCEASCEERAVGGYRLLPGGIEYGFGGMTSVGGGEIPSWNLEPES